MTRNLNATPLQYLSTSPTFDQTKVTYLTQTLANPFAGLVPAGTFLASTTIARERLLRPFPQFDQVTTTTNQGYSWYHSLQMNLERRFNNGFTFQASYTFSKFMEAITYLNAADPLPTEVISDFDRPHRYHSDASRAQRKGIGPACPGPDAPFRLPPSSGPAPRVAAARLRAG